jgi:predicted transposase YdaD
MRESVIYQDILEEGRQEEGVTMVLRLLTRRFGELDEGLRSRIAALPLPLLEELGEALLDFSQRADLDTWLASHRS